MSKIAIFVYSIFGVALIALVPWALIVHVLESEPFASFPGQTYLAACICVLAGYGAGLAERFEYGQKLHI